MVCNSDDFAVTLALAALVFFLVAFSRKRAAISYPPGPKGNFLLGNLLDIPRTFEWITYDRWCKELGSDMVYLRVAGKSILVLNTLDVANELFEKKSAIYSSRPQFPMTVELMGWNWLMAGMEYGEPWKERRRMFTQYFNSKTAILYRPMMLKFIREMLPSLAEDPQNYVQIIRHTFGGLPLCMAYGLRIKKSKDPYIDLAEKAMAGLVEASLPGDFMVNVIPLLKYVPSYFPGAGFQKKALEWKALQEAFRRNPFEQTIKDIAAGLANPCFVTASIEKLHESPDPVHELEIIKDTAGMMFTAGADTVGAAVQWLFCAMLCFPEVQRKAQEELDQVLRGRLPEFEDELDLPYISALITEVLRWHPVAPVAIPHSTTQDDVYKDYFIPKGTFVMGNVWAMMRDEQQYPEPDKFMPERFLKDGKLNTDIQNPVDIAFGFGRRSCPGVQIAMSILWLTAATVLATFEISEGIDENGQRIRPIPTVQPGLICTPMPCRCTIKPRSKVAEDLIGMVTETV